MSNKLTRKGLAFGALVALGSTLFAGVPASANSSGPLTLLPDGGTRDGATYTSLIGAGITLTSVLDANKQSVQVTETQPAQSVTDDSGNVSTIPAQTYIVTPLVDPLADAWYVVTNPGAADIRIDVDSEDFGYYVYDADGVAGGVAGADDGDFDAGSVGVYDYGAALKPDGSGADLQEDLYVDITSGLTNVYITNATKIAVRAADDADDTPGLRSVADLFVDAEDADQDTKITLTVTVLADTIKTGGTQIGVYNNGEYKSATQTVTLLDPASVRYTTSLDDDTMTRASDNYRASVTIGSDVNPYAVAASDNLGVIFYRNGVAIGMEDDAGNVNIATDDSSEYVEVYNDGYDYIETSGLQFYDEDEDSSDLSAGVYSARAVWVGTSPDQYAGARSVVLDLRNGTNSLVDGIRSIVASTDDIARDDSDTAVRSGTESVTMALQITDGSEDLANAGVRVRVDVSADALDEDSEVTVGANTLADGEDVTYYAFTNDSGRVNVTLNNSGAVDGDTVSVSYSVLDDTGNYIDDTDQTFTWADAVLQDEFEVSPSGILAGDTINVTFTAVDQWGVGMDSTEDGRISFKVEAVVDGVIDTDEYSETEPTTDGAASFSFANFATAGNNQEIIVYMAEANVERTGVYYTVYKNLATSSIVMADQFDTDVEYYDWVTGDASKAAVAAAAADVISSMGEDEGDEYALISGTVLDANNAGQPGVAVTIAADGVLFYDDSDTFIIAQDSITVYANAQGYFDVKAAVQTVNTSGRTVTVTADGKSTTTLLKSYLESGIQAEDMKLTWSLPETFVKNTTYAVQVSLTDVYGNPIRTFKTEAQAGDDYGVNALTIAGEGSLQVNGVAEVERNFGLTGAATVFVRSVTDIAGPGSITAVLADSFNYYTGRAAADYGSTVDAASTYLNDTDTSWDESTWTNVLTEVVDVLDAAPVATGKVNAGSFNGYVAVYAKGFEGQTLSWKIAGKWFKTTVTSDYQVFQRKTIDVGATVNVDLYINGVKLLSKSVLTR